VGEEIKRILYRWNVITEINKKFRFFCYLLLEEVSWRLGARNIRI
jgi:hypothetical protein